MEDRFIKRIKIDWSEVSRSSYLMEIEALRGLEELEFNSNVTFFVGENGSGKSTLIEAIAVSYGFNPEGGTMNYRFSTYDDVPALSEALRIVRGPKRPQVSYFFRAESFFNLATKSEEYVEDGSQLYGGKQLHHQSHGESFLAFFTTFQGKGLYIMDEPEAALSPQRQLTLFIYIAEMAKKGAQFIIATHSPILLGIPGAEIYSFDGGGIHRCDYEDTESYKITEMFINDRERLIKGLLAEEE